MIEAPRILDENKQYYITLDDLEEIPYIKNNKSNLKFYLKKIYNELWIDDFERVDINKQIYKLDYIIEDNNNNNNYLCGNSNYIYQYFIDLFENNEYEFEHNKIYSSTTNKTIKPQIIKKKFSNKLLIRYIEIYFILHGYIKLLNIDINIYDIYETHALQSCLNNITRNWQNKNTLEPLKLTNKIIYNDDDKDPIEDNFFDIVKARYKYNFTFDNVDYLIKTFIKNKHHKIII